MDDITCPGAKGFSAGSGDWPFRGFLVRDSDGVRAFANVCPHQGHTLNLDPDDFLIPDGSLISCASHGALFQASDGMCVAGPCVGRSLTPLQCQIREGAVWVRSPATHGT